MTASKSDNYHSNNCMCKRYSHHPLFTTVFVNVLLETYSFEKLCKSSCEFMYYFLFVPLFYVFSFIYMYIYVHIYIYMYIHKYIIYTYYIYIYISIWKPFNDALHKAKIVLKTHIFCKIQKLRNSPLYVFLNVLLETCSFE